MPPVPREALAEQRGFAADVRTEGRRVTMLRVVGAVDQGTGERVSPPVEQSATGYAIVKPMALHLVDGANVLIGDVVVIVAELAFEPFREVLGAWTPISPPEWSFLSGGNPTVFPLAGEPGVRRLQVIARIRTMDYGGFAIGHEYQCRE